MPFSPGDKLGAYEIVSLLGKGGMGEVYRARDPKLNREVAIKVLPAVLANDADYLARFQREAQTLAALNHPNIATIYGLESNAIVMELVEGATLQGPMPLKEALPLARQIAEALEAAHDKGIIHRDLKPGNIKVTPEGVVKVLDFGLAKAVNERPTVTGPDSPTLTMRATEAGLILGTAGYMSPEQAAGKTVDRRADIWSFGVVLYELFTGKRMFDGETVSHTLAHVLTREIDLTGVPLRELIERCLDRDIKHRLQHIGEARIAIEKYAPTQAPAPVQAKASWWPWAVTGVTSIALIAAAIGWYNATRPTPLRPLMRLHLDLPQYALALGALNTGRMIALSPDGTRLALTMRGTDGKNRIHVRLLHQEGLKAIAGTEDCYYPFFSPDGAWIGFSVRGELKKVAVEGGPPATIGPASRFAGASWGDDGNIVASVGRGISRIPAGGGDSVSLTEQKPGESGHRWPHVLPGSKAVLYTAVVSPTENRIEAVTVGNKEPRVIVRDGEFARYVPGAAGTGHVIYLHGTALFAVPFDPERLEVLGPPAPILEDISTRMRSGPGFTTSQSGALAFWEGSAMDSGTQISWVDPAGVRSTLHAARNQYISVRFAPGGKRLALEFQSPAGTDIWVKDLERDTLSRLSHLPGTNSRPIWTPDGKFVFFQLSSASARGLYAAPADGSSEPKLVPGGDSIGTAWSISPDGKRLAVIQQPSNDRRTEIFTIPIEPDTTPGGSGFRLGKPEPFISTPFSERTPTFSRDGRWLAYPSEESGRTELYVRPFPGPGGKWQISNGGGHWPVWSPDGRELLYAADEQIMAVRYTVKGGDFVAEKPRLWTTAKLVASETVGYRYDISADGKRLAGVFATGEDEEKPPSRLTFLVNFADELRRKSPLP